MFAGTMAPLPPGGSLPYGGNIPPDLHVRPDDLVNDPDPVVRNLARSNDRITRQNLDLRYRIAQLERRDVQSEEKIAALSNLVLHIQGELATVRGQANYATTLAQQAWAGTFLLAVLSIAGPAYKGACWAGKTAKAVALSAKATLASYGITSAGISSVAPIALGAP